MSPLRLSLASTTATTGCGLFGLVLLSELILAVLASALFENLLGLAHLTEGATALGLAYLLARLLGLSLRRVPLNSSHCKKHGYLLMFTLVRCMEGLAGGPSYCWALVRVHLGGATRQYRRAPVPTIGEFNAGLMERSFAEAPLSCTVRTGRTWDPSEIKKPSADQQNQAGFFGIPRNSFFRLHGL